MRVLILLACQSWIGSFNKPSTSADPFTPSCAISNAISNLHCELGYYSYALDPDMKLLRNFARGGGAVEKHAHEIIDNIALRAATTTFSPEQPIVGEDNADEQSVDEEDDHGEVETSRTDGICDLSEPIIEEEHIETPDASSENDTNEDSGNEHETHAPPEVNKRHCSQDEGDHQPHTHDCAHDAHNQKRNMTLPSSQPLASLQNHRICNCKNRKLLSEALLLAIRKAKEDGDEDEDDERDAEDCD